MDEVIAFGYQFPSLIAHGLHQLLPDCFPSGHLKHLKQNPQCQLPPQQT